LVVSRDTETGEAHGSGRSIAGFHLLDALESAECRPLFTRFGGHAHAVGFSLPCENVSRLREALERYAAARLTADNFVQEIEVDVELPIADVSEEMLATLQRLEPFGMGNREPVLVLRGARLLQSPRVLKEKHIKLRVGHMDGNRVVRPLDALGWRMAESVEKMALLAGDTLDVAFKLDENDHPDFGGLQLVLCDVQRAKAETAAAV
jgi:single-stranded-DNA-specific exonuclease